VTVQEATNRPGPAGAGAPGCDPGKIARHFRQILLWPVYLSPLDDEAPIDNHWDALAASGDGNPWREVDDEFGAPSEFQERHYNEFVTFLPQVQRFLYGQGLGKQVQKIYGESPIKVMRRDDVARARVTLRPGHAPVELLIKHIDLYFFYDIDIALLAFEAYTNDLPIETANELLFRFGRAYPAYWEADGTGGHCAAKVEWLSAAGDVLAASDYENREKYLSFVCRHRAPNIAAHWDYLLRPLVLHHSDDKGLVRYRQLEYYRLPYMAFLAFDNSHLLTRSDQVRLALGTNPDSPGELPYSHNYLKDFEDRYCYDRYSDGSASGHRFMASGHALVTLGDAGDRFFMDADSGILGRFRHQHFLLFLIAHFQKAALRMYSDRSVATLSRLDLKSATANRTFRRETRAALENFLRFEHRYWFHEISNHAQTRDLFDMLQKHLNLDALFQEVREELQDMGNYLDVEAMRRQNDSMVRLTVVTTFGLIGTVTTGFLGMNLFGWSEQPAAWRFAAFMTVFVPTIFLTLYTVMKSSRLSEFLEALADDRLGIGGKAKALLAVWFGK
jgi:hypothetical protein